MEIIEMNSVVTQRSPRCATADLTLSPIPVRCCPLVTALVGEHVFEVLNIISVPWEEHPRKVDLLIGLKNDGTEDAKGTLVLRSICKYTISKPKENQHQRVDNLRSSRTIVERARFVYRRDQRNVRWDGRRKLGIMRKSSEALKAIGQDRE